MKRKIVIITLFLFIITCIIGYFIIQRAVIINNSRLNNKIFEEYINDEITGAMLITLINKALDNNIYNNIEKDEKQNFINNNLNSIQIEVKFKEKDEIVNMEAINKSGIESFIKYYSNKKFIINEIKYHNKTKNVSYIKFEEK